MRRAPSPASRPNDLLFAEDHEPFDDERYCDDRHAEKEIDRPAGSLDDGKQQRSPSKTPDTLACDCGFGKAENFRNMPLGTQRTPHEANASFPPPQTQQPAPRLY